MKDHFNALWKEIKSELGTSKPSVIEIGSNDGDFLKHCLAYGAKQVTGIEPALNLSELANKRGIPTFCFPFGVSEEFQLDDRVADSNPDVIVARHVFCHMDKWELFIVELERSSAKNTLVVIEVPYVLDTLQRCEFDQVYHEHLSYLSLKAMQALLKDSAFQMHKVTRYPVHGGAIAIFLRRKDSGIKPHEGVARMLSEENITESMWREFALWSEEKINRLVLYVAQECRGNKVCGFGASAKSTVWIQSCGFTKNEIAFICDNTPQKQGKLSPGTEIPIVPESHLTRETADVCINFAWNFHKEVAEKLKPWIEAGGKLVNPHEL